jgi:Pyridoxamine 5'-phosphate oxidase
VRSAAQRRLDALAKLNSDEDIWIATGDHDGVPHLVPLSLCWHDGAVVVAVETRSRTAINALRSGRARAALGPSRDVVMVDAEVTPVPRPEAPDSLINAYRERTGWDPSASGGDWVYLVLRPVRVQVWRDEEEIGGRTVMRNGAWVD